MKNLILGVCLLITASAMAQQVAKGLTAANNEYIGFYEFKPADYNADPTKKFPLIIFLHGQGERGNGTTELHKVLTNAIPKYINQGHPMRFFWNGEWQSFVVLSPQLSMGYGWWYHFYIDEMIKYAKANLQIDTNRIILTGLSLGGGGTSYYAGSTLDHAKNLAAVGLCCPTCQAENWCNIANANLPFWAFHATDDGTIPSSCTSGMVSGLNSCNPAEKPYLTIWNNGGHGIWDRVFDTGYGWQNPNIYEWFLGKDRSKPANIRPITVAGKAITISAASAKVNLSGAFSRDIDGRIVRYVWRKIAGPAVGTISTPVSENGLAKVSGLSTAGTYQFELKAVDDRADWTTDTLTVTVVNGSVPNVPPVTEAGQDQDVNLPHTNLDGEKSYDPDGDVVAYSWRKVAGPSGYTLTAPDAVTPVVSDLLIGTYAFELETTDDGGAKTTDTVLVRASSSPLPLQLLFFKGNRTPAGHQLVWATTSEWNHDRFEIEGSVDGDQFQTIGTVPGAGNSSEQQTYSFTDKGNSTHYRLKMTGKDGKATHSAIVYLQPKSAASLEYFPNPTKDQLTVLLNDTQRGLLQIRIVSMDGKKSLQQQWLKHQDVMSTTLHLGSLPAGIYLMEVTVGNQWREVKKIVKENR